MGNQGGKLARNFSSLPQENFPSLKVEISTNDGARSGSDRIISQQLQQVDTRQISNNSTTESDFDRLFFPVFCRNADINETHFEVTGVIAGGAFGNVAKVVRKSDGVVYAMKVSISVPFLDCSNDKYNSFDGGGGGGYDRIMDKHRLIAERAVQQSKDEATIQNSVGYHPFIVKPYWFFQNDLNVFIVMEYISCGELFAKWQKSDYFSFPLVRLYIAELSMVLDFLHKSGIIYRDLKMENILVDTQGHLHVTDFGLAKRLKIGQRTLTICGTLQYIAPEVANGQLYGHATDWWSLGILMYALLSGQFPVSEARDHVEMAGRMSMAQYYLPPGVDVPNAARHLLSRRSPGNRLQSLDMMKKHPCFAGVNFEWLYERKLNPASLEENSSNSGGNNGTNGQLVNGKKRRTVRTNAVKVSNERNNQPNQFRWNEPIASLGGMVV